MTDTMPKVSFVRPRRVLIADEAASCQHLLEWFTARGYVAVGRENGEEALNAFREGFFDLVLTDAELPGLSGMQLLRIIKEINPRVPVIMIGRSGNVQAVVEALKRGAENYLIKPLKDEDLSMVMEQALNISCNLMGAKVFEGQARQRTCLKCPSRSELIAEVVFVVAQSAVNMNFVEYDLDNNIKLAIVEALTNAMEHGHNWNPDLIVNITVDVSSRQMRLWVEDQGTGFDHSSRIDPTDPENLLLERGRGIFLMRAIMDEVAYHNQGRMVELVKNAPVSGQPVV